MSTTSDRTLRRLTEDQVSEYDRDGFVILRNVFAADEIAELEREASALWWRQDLVDKDNIRCRWKNHVETGECTFECFDPVIDIGPLCAKFARDERILAALGDLYGDRAHLFKDKLIFKPPGTEGYSLHQDFIAWENFPRSFITVLVAIDPADAENGATEVFPGYHKQGCLTPEDGLYHDLPPESVDLSTGVKLDLAAGDIGLFGAFTPHRSAANRSAGWRRQLYLSYTADADGGDLREKHYAYFHEWLKERYAEYGKQGVWFK